MGGWAVDGRESTTWWSSIGGVCLFFPPLSPLSLQRHYTTRQHTRSPLVELTDTDTTRYLHPDYYLPVELSGGLLHLIQILSSLGLFSCVYWLVVLSPGLGWAHVAWHACMLWQTESLGSETV